MRRTDNANQCEEKKKCELEGLEAPRAISIDLINDDADSSSVPSRDSLRSVGIVQDASTDVRPKRRIVTLYAKIRERSECAGKRRNEC